MGRKHKHEEHENHERWVISYADMVTLLFALFVVLYALGEVKMKKLKQLKQSLAFAFSFEGHGQTQELGLHDQGERGGDLLDAVPLINPQKLDMQEFLLQSLPEEFEEISGHSLDYEQTDDTVKFSGPLSSFFTPLGRAVKPKIHPWLTKLVEGAHSVASQIRIHIRAHKVRLSTWSDGSPFYSRDLCLRRLGYMQSLVGLMNKVMENQVKIEFDIEEGSPPPGKSWDEVATITFFFSNPDR